MVVVRQLETVALLSAWHLYTSRTLQKLRHHLNDIAAPEVFFLDRKVVN